MKKLIALMTLFAVLLSATAFAADSPWDDSKTIFVDGDVSVTAEQREAGLPIFEIKLENGGVMRGELYPQIAPESVGNFILLSNSGFYDGLIFHRVIAGFVLQGGCPLGEGYGGPGWQIKGEFAANGVENGLRHSYGMLSMARSQQNDSAGSQFFIMSGDAPFLDGNYAAFGKVIEGMEYAYDIAAVPQGANNKPLEPQTIKSVRVETFGVDYPFTKIQ